MKVHVDPERCQGHAAVYTRPDSPEMARVRDRQIEMHYETIDAMQRACDVQRLAEPVTIRRASAEIVP